MKTLFLLFFLFGARVLCEQDLLQVTGIDEQRISCEGFSNSQPLAEETSEEAMALNRRVEVVFVEKE